MSTTAPENPSVTRGRTAASKPLISSKAKSTVPASGSTSTKPARTPSASSTVSSKSASTSAKPKAASTTSETGFKVTKLSSTTVTLPTTWTPKPVSEPTPAPPRPSNVEQPQTRTSDPLQVAAQVYPWTYMTSTLDACFKGAEKAATTDLENRANEISAGESEIADQRDRLEAERAIEFFDELGSAPFAKDAPEIMESFHSHGESCTHIETEALKLAMRNAPDPPEEDPLKVYQDMLHNLEKLQEEATNIQNSILKLSAPSVESSTTEDDKEGSSKAGSSSARSQVSGVFAACLPVLRARIANLTMAQELIDTTLENVSLGLRMESMGLID